MTAPVVVLGDVDLVRPLQLAGIPCAVFAPPGDPVRASRRLVERLPWADPWEHPRRVVDTLLAFARRMPGRPVLMPQGDGELVVASRHREELSRAYRMQLPPAALVEDLVDKRAFAALAERCGLPVPRTRIYDPAEQDPPDDLRFPVVLKPATHAGRSHVAGPDGGKVRIVDDAAALRAAGRALAGTGVVVLAQEAVPGPETRIESYHAYVDPEGETVAEFTGRKIRTLPPVGGHSTAVEITVTADVRAAGRDVLRRIGLRGVAKVDFKRAPDGRLVLLEVNPRFTLWHHAAAVAGVNVPALVYADLVGSARPPGRFARPGVTWCSALPDAVAARHEMPLAAWARWALGCEAVSGLARDDPGPFLSATLWAPVRDRVRPRQPASASGRRMRSASTIASLRV